MTAPADLANNKIILRGRKVVGGVAEGEALVTRDTISGWGGINEREGTVIERRHELRGVSFKDKILVFPGAKGSSGWSAYFHMTRLNGVEAQGDDLQQDDDQDRARRGRHPFARRSPNSTGPARRHRDRRLGQGRCRQRHRRNHQEGTSLGATRRIEG